MAAKAATVAVVGMRAIRRDLNRMDKDVTGPIYKALTAAGRAAAEPIAARARSVVPRRSGRLGGSIRVNATRTGAGVRMGRASVPYAGWVEFGGTNGAGGERQYIPTGRYLFPAATGLAETSARTYSAELEKAFSRSDLWSNTTTNPEEVRD